MNDDDLREEEERSLLKDIAKNGISKIIKNTMPLKTKLIIFSVIFGIVFSLLLFAVLFTPLYIKFFSEDSKNNNSSNLVYIDNNSEDNYWWPIGGAEVEEYKGEEYATGDPTSIRITSYFSASRTLGGETKAHDGMDIGSSGGADYIIAVANGTVYSASDTCGNDGNLENYCGGGGFGNYVIIEHPGSVYTIYAHLYPDSITVSVGDSVKQGQIIGKMGNSGRSTGTHLHFQLEIGGRNSTYAVDPLNYISSENPRPVTKLSGSVAGTSDLLMMLQSWEGTGPMDGDNYKVYDDGYGTLTVGHGVTLEYNVERFAKRGINVSNLSEGDSIEKDIVDDIELEIVNENRTLVINILHSNDIVLEEYQIDALVIRMYNVGNINAFPTHYKTYGNTQALYDNYMSKPVTSNGETSSGLDRRRQAEWKLFHTGVYTLN